MCGALGTCMLSLLEFLHAEDVRWQCIVVNPATRTEGEVVHHRDNPRLDSFELSLTRLMRATGTREPCESMDIDITLTDGQDPRSSNEPAP
ncbi:hypothetical protein H4582DRAFT_1283369 [Lactarius indigo]|nr:hypothetical protein H4582DRAFT_1283369 [Lactarius indigo]